jgi:hypothetical protein
MAFHTCNTVLTCLRIWETQNQEARPTVLWHKEEYPQAEGGSGKPQSW